MNKFKDFFSKGIEDYLSKHNKELNSLDIDSVMLEITDDLKLMKKEGLQDQLKLQVKEFIKSNKKIDNDKEVLNILSEISETLIFIMNNENIKENVKEEEDRLIEDVLFEIVAGKELAKEIIAIRSKTKERGLNLLFKFSEDRLIESDDIDQNNIEQGPSKNDISTIGNNNKDMGIKRVNKIEGKSYKEYLMKYKNDLKKGGCKFPEDNKIDLNELRNPQGFSIGKNKKIRAVTVLLNIYTDLGKKIEGIDFEITHSGIINTSIAKLILEKVFKDAGWTVIEDVEIENYKEHLMKHKDDLKKCGCKFPKDNTIDLSGMKDPSKHSLGKKRVNTCILQLYRELGQEIKGINNMKRANKIYKIHARLVLKKIFKNEGWTVIDINESVQGYTKYLIKHKNDLEKLGGCKFLEDNTIDLIGLKGPGFFKVGEKSATKLLFNIYKELGQEIEGIDYEIKSSGNIIKTSAKLILKKVFEDENWIVEGSNYKEYLMKHKNDLEKLGGCKFLENNTIDLSGLKGSNSYDIGKDGNIASKVLFEIYKELGKKIEGIDYEIKSSGNIIKTSAKLILKKVFEDEGYNVKLKKS